MTSLFCPLCGKDVSDLYDRLCKDCFVDQLRLIEYPYVLHVTTCPTCGSIFRKGRWTLKEPEEVIFSVVEEGVTIHPEAESITLSIDPEIQEGLIRVFFTVEAKVKGLSVSEGGELEIRVKKESCDRCSRISSGYHEGIIQVRAEERSPTQKEIKICENRAYDLVEQLQERDRLAFISKVTKLKEGIDIYVGSMASGRQIARSISNRFGVSCSESSKLVGQKDGRKLYRVTFSVRLPKFAEGDIIQIDDRVALVRRYEKNVTGIDLRNWEHFSLNRSRIVGAEFLGKRCDAVEAVLCTVYDYELDILDPDTYKTVRLKKPKKFEKPENSEVLIIRIKERIFLVP